MYTKLGEGCRQPRMTTNAITYSDSVLTLYGLILALILNLFKLTFSVLGS